MQPIISILIVFLILFVIFWCVRKFIADATVQSVIGIILAIIFIVYSLHALGIGNYLKV